MNPRSRTLLRLPAPSELLPRSSVLQRKCACGSHTIAGAKCSGCSKRETTLQRSVSDRDVDNRNGNAAPAIVHEVLNSPGQPLDATTRAFFEPRFGHDFSRVRVHSDAMAAESARTLDALAYTVGNHVTFGRGHYQPDRINGQRLLAHELTHVIQQEGGPITLGASLSTGSIDTPAEREADRLADSVTRRGAPIVNEGPLRWVFAERDTQVQRLAAPTTKPKFQGCTKARTGRDDANEILGQTMNLALKYVEDARKALEIPPEPASTYEEALQIHFGRVNNAQRRRILRRFGRIAKNLTVKNFKCVLKCSEDQNAQAFWNADDGLINVCPKFWMTSDNICKAIIIIHESGHDAEIDITSQKHLPNRGSESYPTMDQPETKQFSRSRRRRSPDAYAFFAAHVSNGMDTPGDCF
jgi:hypothetical protein